MESFIIEGGHPLQGTITPQGAKNEALQVICTTILTDEPVRITNVPDILDVNNLIKLLQEIGVKVTRNSRHDYTFQSDELKLDYLDSLEFVKKCSSLRGSVLMFGPLLGRFGKATIAKPGGDKIGRRRLDTHFLGFKYLGATFVHDEERNVYQIQAKKLKGCYMLLDEASVTGTANIIMAAVLAKGTTTIYNAACEPYIQQLCHLLNSMGAQISGIARNLLTLAGVALLLYGVVRTIVSKTYIRGIWPAGVGVVLVVLSLLLVAGYADTAYYPSNADLQCSLTIANSCSSEFTLRTMFYVSLLVPFVFAYIAYVWRVMDRK